MKNSNAFVATLLLSFMIVLPVVAPAASAQHSQHADHSADEAAIRTAVDHYLQGHATGDGAHFKMVFHPESKLYWIRDGKLSQRSSEEFIAGASGKPADNEASRKRRIVMVDVTGTAAVVKVELDYPGAMITDYFSMLKVDGEWKIMNKIFDVKS